MDTLINLYAQNGDLFGNWCPKTGRAQLLDKFYVKERKGQIEIAKSGAIYTKYRTTCCGYEWSENDCDEGVANNPEFNYCPGCGAVITDE